MTDKEELLSLAQMFDGNDKLYLEQIAQGEDEIQMQSAIYEATAMIDGRAK